MRLPKILSLAALLLLGSLGLGAQNRTVQGTVSDSSGQPLPGVGVLLQGTTNGTVTGTDGTWQLRVPDSDVILDFSSLGYQSQTVNVPASQGVVNVTMADDNLTLEEFVAVWYVVMYGW